MRYCLLLLILTSCHKYSLSVRREAVDRNSLASTFVGSPDPLQQKPPFGQKLVIEWIIPPAQAEAHPILTLHLIFRNYTEREISYIIDHRRGHIVYTLLDEDYIETEGLLTYRAEIRDQEGAPLQKWKHKLWVRLIHEEP